MALRRQVSSGIEMKNLKLGHRLMILFMVMALIVVITGSFGAWSMKRVGDRIQKMLTNLANQQKQVLLMEVAQNDCHINLLNAATERTEIAKFEDSSEDYQVKRDLFRSQCEIMLKGNLKLGIMPAKPGSAMEAKANGAMNSWAEFEKVADELLAVKRTLLSGARPGGANQAMTDDRLHQKSLEMAQANEKAKTAVDDLLVAVNDQMTQSNKEIAAIQRSAFAAFIVVVLAAIVLAILFGILTSRYIVGRIAKMVHALNRGAEGHLNTRVEINSGDELGSLGEDFNTMLGKLSEMMGKVGKSTGELGRVTDNLSEASRQVVNGAQLQAEGIANTSSAMTQINASIKGVAQGVDGLSQSATESSSSILEMAASV